MSALISSSWEWISLVSAIAAGLVGGILYAFSGFVMRGLSDLDAVEAIRAMQAINVRALGPGLLVVFMGTAAVTLGISAVSLFGDPSPARGWFLTGTALYVVGVIAVTAGGNVPLNEALDVLKPEAATAAAEWRAYERPWLMWNHLRTVAAALSAGAFILAALAA